ncbi:small integral membrane protein 7 isoform X2 [Ailuropoda melanoleuca]|uniref:small integral membrane protein 7 isoform X2 n=1 Tax=Ailuropoda melanoleuca TaxID=9646 RepID=UPI0009478A38|nr:small integral membrane protein 7 isoform X2 [Ailuropoda melanoleuca]
MIGDILLFGKKKDTQVFGEESREPSTGCLAPEPQIVTFLGTRNEETPSQMPSLPFSIRDDFKNGFDWKTSDLPRKPKFVVGGKNVHQAAHGFPATSLFSSQRYFHFGLFVEILST